MSEYSYKTVTGKELDKRIDYNADLGTVSLDMNECVNADNNLLADVGEAVIDMASLNNGAAQFEINDFTNKEDFTAKRMNVYMRSNANNKSFSDYEELISIDDVCDALNIGKNTAYDLLKSGEIKSFRIGRVWKIPKASMQEYITSHTDIPAGFFNR